jgi:glycosyltransferase involved in cell wall biosynthesis
MQTHAAYLPQHLRHGGYQVEVVAYRETTPRWVQRAAEYDEGLGIPVHRVLSRVAFWYNLRLILGIVHRSRPDILYASTVFYGLLGHWLGLPLVCRSVGNDLLRPWIGYPYLFGSRILGMPLIERIGEAWPNRLSPPEWIEALFIRHRLSLTRAAVRQASRIIANSQFTATLLHEWQVPSDRIEIVVGGVDAARFRRPAGGPRVSRQRLGLPEKAFLLLTVCRLVSKKGIDFLLRAVQPLRRIIPDVHLAIIGDGKCRRRYERLATELGITGWVSFLGTIPHEAIHQYYWCCDVFVLASRVSHGASRGGRDVETMGRVLCEANAAEVPVVASRSGGIPSVVEHQKNGLLFDEEDLEDFLAQVRRLRYDPGLAGELTRTGRAFAEESFDWSVVVRQHDRVFGNLLSANPSSPRRANQIGPPGIGSPSETRQGRDVRASGEVVGWCGGRAPHGSQDSG